MCDNRPLNQNLDEAEYNSLAACINKLYCEHHGYDFLYSICNFKNSTDLYSCVDPLSKQPRHAAWARLVKTIELIEQNKYDRIVYIDSDCIFKNHSIKIETFIESNLDKDVVFINNNPWHMFLPCSGFYVSKLNKATLKFFKDWYEMDIPFKNTERYWEQDALWLLIYNLNPKQAYITKLHNHLIPNRPWPQNIGLIDAAMFYEKDLQYLLHICGQHAEYRKPKFTHIIRSNNIPFELVIKNTTTEQFDTSAYYK